MSGTPTKPISAANVLNSTSYAAAKSSSLIRALFEEGATMRAVHGNEVLDFSLGNPTLPPPKEFVEILAQIAEKPPPDLHSYMMNIGRPNTRAALAKEFSKWHDIDLRAENLIITCGAAAAINVLFNCIITTTALIK
ncbi:MAG: Aspartate aminotransferase [Streblomastix strix]|uniref:Aspartate aminotransferase n=1 Tax=Streblomastix strix TaxID=222440 RepID=A0A5J4W0Q3_9EUKA|nr:MAG: Aspartate aminotransferase [Streblomastix strix]